jgi:GGDEF domain-containing protein
MWTRPAFLQFCHVMPRGQRIVMFLDLDGIHGMNLRFGYEQVNERIRTAFSVFYRRSDVVARWFSGDEIVILFDSDGAGAVRKIEQLEEAARRQGLTFTYRLGEWEVGKQAIEEVIDGLAEQVNREKAPKEG